MDIFVHCEHCFLRDAKITFSPFDEIFNFDRGYNNKRVIIIFSPAGCMQLCMSLVLLLYGRNRITIIKFNIHLLVDKNRVVFSSSSSFILYIEYLKS